MVHLIIRLVRRLISILTLLQQLKRYYGQFHIMHPCGPCRGDVLARIYIKILCGRSYIRMGSHHYGASDVLLIVSLWLL